MQVPPSPDVIGLLAATVLTLCVFSYLLGDNFLYRLAIAILIGGGAAYALAIVVWSIIIPRLLLLSQLLLNRSDQIGLTFAVLGMLLGWLMLFKLSPRLAWLGNYSVAFLVGVGAGVAISGAALGTLFTQSQAAANLNSVESLIALVVTLTVFISFAFGVGGRRGLAGLYARALQSFSTVGQAFLVLAFGLVFASVYIASVSVLIGRVQFIVQAIQQQVSYWSGVSF